MATKRKPTPPRLRKRDMPRTYLERNAKLVVTIAGAITAAGVIFNFAMPLLTSHLPSASQGDLAKALDSVNKQTGGIVRQLNSLDIRQSDSIKRGEAITQVINSNHAEYLNSRAKYLRAEISRLDGLRDASSVALRSTDETELAGVEAELKKSIP